MEQLKSYLKLKPDRVTLVPTICEAFYSAAYHKILLPATVLEDFFKHIFADPSLLHPPGLEDESTDSDPSDR